MDLIRSNYSTDADASSPCGSDNVDTSENPKELPRIGDMFQAQIPPVSVEYEQRTSCLLSTLAIPIMWAHFDLDHSKKTVLEHETSLESSNNEDGHTTSNGRYPFPGSLGKPWSELERESFVLGLYIFGKNMLIVKKFVECKEMGDILSFYYGDFYKSDRYYKWAQFLKRRNTRSLHGHKIFSAGKLHELFSRLACHTSEKCQNELLEVSRTFEEGKLPLEEFVDTLKKVVGIDKLIEAVGIGRGKQDLTLATTVQKTIQQPTKKKQKPLSSIRRKMPFLKACSTLSTGDIVKLLTGDSRLGKARSNDLFWEAVWPRLLARGWHSEYRNKHGDSGLKDNLVFLMSGIEKFNRRRLKKGEHYFDTLNEVLNMVGKNPQLLNLPGETIIGDRKEETEEQKSDSDESDGMTFTIVDTSLFSGGRRTKTRKLKRIVNGTEKGFGSISCSSDDEQNIPKESGNDSSVRETCVNSSDCVTSIVNNNSHALDSTEESPTSCFSNEDQTAISSKCEISSMVKCGDSSSDTAVPQELRHKTKTMSLNNNKKKFELHSSTSSSQSMVCRVGSTDHLPESRNESPQQPKPLKLLVKGPSRIQRPPPVQLPERRQSTRSRPLTTKALEAIESGFTLTPNKKRKIIEPIQKNDTRIANLSPV